MTADERSHSTRPSTQTGRQAGRTERGPATSGSRQGRAGRANGSGAGYERLPPEAGRHAVGEGEDEEGEEADAEGGLNAGEGEGRPMDSRPTQTLGPSLG